MEHETVLDQLGSPGAGSGGSSILGSQVRRVEDPELLRGRGRFVDNIDIQDAGVLHAVFVRSPVAHAWLGALVADQLGLPLEQIRYVQSDTAVIRSGGGTGGARSLQLGGSAVHTAAVELRQKVVEVAAELLEVADDDVDGSTFPFGTHVSVVEVDVPTGAVRLLRHVQVDDCGTVINPLLVQGQQHGGIAQGISQALWEEFRYDEAGQPVTSTFADYPLPSTADLIALESSSTVTPTDRNPLGAKGIGEAATIGATPAVQNAVIDAVAHLGVRHIDIPCTPERVHRAILEAARGEHRPWREPPAYFGTMSATDAIDDVEV